MEEGNFGRWISQDEKRDGGRHEAVPMIQGVKLIAMCFQVSPRRGEFIFGFNGRE